MNVANPNQIRSRYKRIVFIPNQPVEPVAIGPGTTNYTFDSKVHQSDFDVGSNRQTMESTPYAAPNADNNADGPTQRPSSRRCRKKQPGRTIPFITKLCGSFAPVGSSSSGEIGRIVKKVLRVLQEEQPEKDPSPDPLIQKSTSPAIYPINTRLFCVTVPHSTPSHARQWAPVRIERTRCTGDLSDRWSTFMLVKDRQVAHRTCSSLA